jgi:hypothetical protein
MLQAAIVFDFDHPVTTTASFNGAETAQALNTPKNNAATTQRQRPPSRWISGEARQVEASRLTVR